MKICVFGAGAIGGHLAARLWKGGAEVSVIARGPHLDAIQKNGLVVQAPDGEIRAPVKASSDAADLGPQDCVVVTVKAPALASVAAGIGPLLGPDTPVAFLMNGMPWWFFHNHGGALGGRRLPRIDPGDAVWNAVGPKRVLGGVVGSPCSVIAPGIVHVGAHPGRVGMGEIDGAISPRAEALAGFLRAGGMEVNVSAKVREVVLEKLVGNMSGMPLSVLTLASVAVAGAVPGGTEAVRRMVREVMALAAALGHPLDLDVERNVSVVSKNNHKSSMTQDMEFGRPPEIDSIFRVPLELAQELGVPMPTLDFLAGLITVRARSAGLYKD